MNYINTTLDTKIKERLQGIANTLALNVININNMGLINGKMGIAIFFYHYARQTGKEYYENLAGELIDEIYKGIRSGANLDFANGLVGIGWGFEHLLKNDFVEVDTDEMLEDIDNAISIKKDAKNNIELVQNYEEIYGFGLYYMARLKSKGINELENRRIYKNILRDSEFLLSAETLFGNDISKNSTSRLISVIHFLTELQKLKLFPNKVLEHAHSLPSYVEQKFDGGYNWVEKDVLLFFFKSFLNTLDEKSLKDKCTELSNKLVSDKLPHTKDEGELIGNFISAAWFPLLYDKQLKRDNKYELLFQHSKVIIENDVFWDDFFYKFDTDRFRFDKGLLGLGMSLMKFLDN